MTTIFIESKHKKTNEYVFVDTYIRSVLKKPNDSYEIVCIDGFVNIKNIPNINKLKENEINGNRSLILFDADSEKNHGGCNKRREWIENVLAKNSVNADIFLFPNNSDDGMFEDLLENISQKSLHQRFFDCFSDYEACLGEDYNHPNQKAKMYAYITSMKDLNKNERDHIGRGQWLYDNLKYWNLSSPYLKSLHDCLNSVI